MAGAPDSSFVNVYGPMETQAIISIVVIIAIVPILGAM